MKCDTEQPDASEDMTAQPESSSGPNADLTPTSRKSVRSSTGERLDEQNRRRRGGRQISTSQEGATETEDSSPGTSEPGCINSASGQTMSETAGI